MEGRDKDMEITVNEQTQRFYLAFDEWKEVVGHEIKVGKYQFCAIPMNGIVNVSEVTSGLKIIEIPMNLENMILTESKEGSIRFFNKVGESLKRIIENDNNFDIQLTKRKKTAFKRLGKMPKIENIDVDWIFEDTSDVLN